MDKIKELQDQRIKAAKRANALRDLAKDSDAGFTSEQRDQFDANVKAIAAVDGQIKMVEADQQRMAASFTSEKVETKAAVNHDPNADADAALRGWLLAPQGQATDAQQQAMQRIGLTPGQKQLSFSTSQKRALSVGTTTAGGHTVPDDMMTAIEKAKLAFGGVASVSRIIKTATGADLPMPTSNDTSNSAALVAENAQISDTDVTFGQTVLKSYKYGSLVRVSRELAQDSSVDMASYLGEVLGERIGRGYNTAQTTGTGSSQPSGCVTGAADSGVTTSAAAALTYANLVSIYHSVDPAYRANGTWMLHDTWLQYIRAIVDSNGLPLWSPSVIVGEPDTILGRPYVVNNDMATATASKVILFGDFSNYVIREVDQVQLMRLDERYADYDQIAFLAFSRMDSAVLNAGTNPIKYATSA